MIKVTYLDHSGFLVELEDAYFLFDYYKGRLPQIDLEKKMFVFVSHAHHDHYRKDIFNLRKHFREIRYVLSSDIEIKAEKDIVQMQPNEKKEVMGAEIRTLRSTDEGVAFVVHYAGKTIYHAGDLNWWHWEGEDPVWNRNMEADFRRYAEPLRGRKIDLAMLPLDPRLGEDGFRGPRYFLELADIRRFLPMHQWGNFNFTNQFLSCYTSFTSRTVYVNRVGQVFTFEEEADT